MLILPLCKNIAQKRDEVSTSNLNKINTEFRNHLLFFFLIWKFYLVFSSIKFYLVFSSIISFLPKSVLILVGKVGENGHLAHCAKVGKKLTNFYNYHKLPLISCYCLISAYLFLIIAHPRTSKNKTLLFDH